MKAQSVLDPATCRTRNVPAVNDASVVHHVVDVAGSTTDDAQVQQEGKRHGAVVGARLK